MYGTGYAFAPAALCLTLANLLAAKYNYHDLTPRPRVPMLNPPSARARPQVDGLCPRPDGQGRGPARLRAQQPMEGRFQARNHHHADHTDHSQAEQRYM